MTFINDFADMMNSTAIWRSFKSRNEFGEPTYNDPITYTARLVQKTKLVRNRNGDEVLSTAQLWLGETADTNLIASPDVRPDDQIELANGEKPEILMVERYEDETGIAALTKVFFK